MTITLEDIRHRASHFERRIRWRNLREYAAGVLVVCVFALQLHRLHGWRMTPPVLLIAGTMYALLELHRRGGTRSVPADAGIAASVEFHRRELERQRDALRSVWLWYLLPFAPGLVGSVVAGALDKGIVAGLLEFAAFAIAFGFVGLLNQKAAQGLDRKIQKVRNMEANDE